VLKNETITSNSFNQQVSECLVQKTTLAAASFCLLSKTHFLDHEHIYILHRTRIDGLAILGAADP